MTGPPNEKGGLNPRLPRSNERAVKLAAQLRAVNTITPFLAKRGWFMLDRFLETGSERHLRALDQYLDGIRDQMEAVWAK